MSWHQDGDAAAATLPDFSMTYDARLAVMGRNTVKDGSYANSVRHRGDLYRFDGWKKIVEVRPGRAGGTWTRPRPLHDRERKTLWAFELSEPSATEGLAMLPLT
jgi:hypothetical protein